VSSQQQIVVLDITPYKYLNPRTGGHLGIFYPLQFLGKHSTLYSAGVVHNDTDIKLNYTALPIFKGGALRYINPLYFFRLRKIIKEKEVDVILLQHCYFAWLAILLKKVCNVKLVLRSHNVEYLRFKSLEKSWWPILKKYEQWCVRNCDAVMCVTLDDEAIYKQESTKPIYAEFPFGTSLEVPAQDRAVAQQKIKAQFNIANDEKLILYNGSLGYGPNRIGLDFILEKLNPLLKSTDFKYKILICGSGLADEYNKLLSYSNDNIIYAGFVDDVGEVFKAADVFLNPVIGGGGIKTKLIEAIAYGTTVVSSADGAIGFVQKAASEKIIMCKDNNEQEMLKAVVSVLSQDYISTPQSFYDYYSWNSNAVKAVAVMQKILQA
jgi:polysaccharide biosynthesis protein PslH